MIIVTGGAGFIGSNLVREFNKRGIDDILIVDNVKTKKKNLDSLKFSDYSDKDFFIENLDKLDKKNLGPIFHLGACSDTMEQNWDYLKENNLEYSKTLLNFCLENKKQFIYASSASVYGKGENGFREDASCENPINDYANSKFLFDEYVRQIKNKGSQVVGIRYFNVYGPLENHKEKMASAVYHFHNQILSEGKIKLFEGSENFLRDFIYVTDAVDANIFFSGNPQISGIFNLGTGKAESFLKIAEVMQKLYGNKIEIESIPFPDSLKGKYQAFTEADLSNLRKAGYKKNFVGIEEGVTKYVNFLRNEK
jgi:ADP-L-glycero-D-manno-heptose 6-epimerase